MKRVFAIALFFSLLSGCSFAPMPVASALDNNKEQWEELNSQAYESYQNGKYNQGIIFAEKAYQYAIKRFGKEHPDTLVSMNNLALLYRSQGRYGEAEPLCKEALQLSEKVFGKEHPETLTSMNNLALL